MKSKKKILRKWLPFDPFLNKADKGCRRFKRQNLPDRPGVYKIINKGKTQHQKNSIFYIGETKNLRRRIFDIFNCVKKNSCLAWYKKVYGPPKKETICRQFKALYLDTSGMRGRLEIEEQLQKVYGTNKKGFYKKLKNEKFLGLKRFT